MSDYPIDLLNAPFATGLATGVTLLLFLYGVVKYLILRQRRVYAASARNLVAFGFILDDEVAVVKMGNREFNKVVEDKYLIINKTNSVVDDTSFAKLPFVLFTDSAEIIRVRIASHPRLGSAVVTVEDGRVQLREIILRPREGIILEIVHDGKNDGRMEAVLRHQDRLIYYQPYTEVYKPAALATGTLLALSFSFEDSNFRIAMIALGIISAFLCFWLPKRILLFAEKSFLERSRAILKRDIW